MIPECDPLRGIADVVIARSHELIRSFHQLKLERQLIELQSDSRRVERQIIWLLRSAGIEGVNLST